MKIELFEDEEIHDLEYHNLKIIQKKTGFKFGIDSVLLANYSKKIKKDAIVVDIGTGTGIIAILLAEKTRAKKIIGIEIQKEMSEMASRSIKLNNLENTVNILNCNIKDVENYVDQNSVDVIVSNPPYKKENTGIKNVEKNKLISRHEIECNIDDIIAKSSYMLKDRGSFYMIHRPERLADVLCSLRKYKIEPKNLRFVQSKPNEAPKMFLIKAVKNAGEFLKVEKPLVVYDDCGEYTDEILEFYGRMGD